MNDYIFRCNFAVMKKIIQRVPTFNTFVFFSKLLSYCAIEKMVGCITHYRKINNLNSIG